jgi:tetratricopeptide (TPR) repeat protein
MTVVFLSILCANALTLFEASEGRVGRGVMIDGVPEQCTSIVEMSTLDWLECSKKFDVSNISQPVVSNSIALGTGVSIEEYGLVMWSVTSAIQSKQVDLAFDRFEPLLGVLRNDWKEEYWSIVILEAWLLSSLGLQEDAMKLVGSVPDSATDVAGKQVVMGDILSRQHRYWRRDKAWSRAIDNGNVTAWTWWHRSRWQRGKSQEMECLEQALSSQEVHAIHYTRYVDRLIQNKEWSNALLVSIQGLSRFPEADSLFKKAIVSAQQDAGKEALERLLIDVPEHTKALLVTGFIQWMNNDVDGAWSIFQRAKDIGESSRLFFLLQEQIAAQVSTATHWATVLETAQKFPNDDIWQILLKKMATTVERKRELQILFDVQKTVPQSSEE